MECDCIPPPPPVFDLPPPPDPSLIWHLLSPQGEEDGVADGKVLFDTCDAALKEGSEGTWPFNILTSPSFPTSPGELWSRGDAIHLLLSVLFLALLAGCLTATCVLRRKRLRNRRKHSTPSPSSLESSKFSTKTVATAANTTTTRIVERLQERRRFPSTYAAQQPVQQQHHCHPSASSATVARRVFAVPIRCSHHPTAINYPSSYALSGGGGGNVYSGSQRRTVRMYGSQSSTNIFTHSGHHNMPCAAVECAHCIHAPCVQPNSYHMQHGNSIGKRMMCPPAPSCCSVAASNQGYCTLLGSGGPTPSATEFYEEISTSGNCCHHQHGGNILQQSPPMMLRMSHQQPWATVNCHSADDDGDRGGERVCDDDGLSPTVFEDLSESIRRIDEDADRLNVARRPPPPGPPPPPPLQSLQYQIDFINAQPAGYSVPPPAAGDPVGSMDSLEEGGEGHLHHNSSVGRPSSGDTELERLSAGMVAEGGKGHHPASFGGSPPNQAESKSGESQVLERSPLSTGSNGGGCGGRESGYGTGGNSSHYVVGKSQLQSSTPVAQNTPPIPQRRPKRDDQPRNEEIPLQLSPPARTAESSSREETNAAQSKDEPDGLTKNRSITYV